MVKLWFEQDWRPTLIGRFRYYGGRARQDNVQARCAWLWFGQDWRGDPLWLGVFGTTVGQRCKTTYKTGESASTARKTGDPIRLVGIQRVKCRMKCFYETWSHGPQDQKFDGIRRNIYLQISDFGSRTRGARYSLVEWSDTYVSNLAPWVRLLKSEIWGWIFLRIPSKSWILADEVCVAWFQG